MNTIELPFATVAKIPNEQFGDMLYALFPQHCMSVERAHYLTLGEMTLDYYGGLWTGYTNPERTIFFMVPPDKQYHLQISSNGYDGELSAEATGIVTSLVVLNRLVWQTHNPAHNELFYNLRTWAMDHPEATEIFGAID